MQIIQGKALKVFQIYSIHPCCVNDQAHSQNLGLPDPQHSLQNMSP